MAALTQHPFAPICGFEMMLDADVLPAPGTTIQVEAVAHSGEGRVIGTARIRVEPAGPVDHPLPPRPAPRRAREESPVRVLAATNSFGIGGAPTFVTHLLRALAAAGLGVTAVAPEDGIHRGWLEEAGIAARIHPAPPVDDVHRYEAWLDAARPLVSRADVVLANTLLGFGFADAATRAGIPVVWAVHEAMGIRPFWRIAYGDGMHPAVRALAEDALRSSIVTINASSIAGGVRAVEPRIIRYGVDLQDLGRRADRWDRQAVRQAERIAGEARVVLCVGTVEERKGQGVLVQAFQRIATRHKDAVLVLVGARDGDALPAALRDHLRRVGLEARVRVIPADPQAERWYVAADLLVCASDIEVLPLAVIEGMGLGLPVVSTRVFGLPEVVLEGRTGFLCDPCDVADLASALDDALSDPARLADMGIRARRLIERRHALQPFVDEYEELLARAARRPAGAP